MIVVVVSHPHVFLQFFLILFFLHIHRFNGEDFISGVDGITNGAARGVSKLGIKGLIAAAAIKGIQGIIKTTKASHASASNDEFKDGFSSAMRNDTTTIMAEAKCDVYRAILNTRVSKYFNLKILE